MASTWEISQKAKIYLAGYSILLLGFSFFIAGFATDHWLSVGDNQYGLWPTCLSSLCADADNVLKTIDLGWLQATRALQIMALMAYIVGSLGKLFFLCHSQVSQFRPRRTWQLRFFEICVLVGNIFCFNGIVVSGSRGDSLVTLRWSYGLTIVGLILTTAGLVMVFCSRSAETTNNTVVSPSNIMFTDASRPQNLGQYPGPDIRSHGRHQHLPPITPSAPLPSVDPPSSRASHQSTLPSVDPPSYTEAIGRYG